MEFCGGDEGEAALIWKLMSAFSETTKIKIPLDWEAGRDQLKNDWWPFLRQIFIQSDREYEVAADAIRAAQKEMDQSTKNLTLASPKSIVKKAIGVIGRLKRGENQNSRREIKEQTAKSNGTYPKGWNAVARRREEILQQQVKES